MVWEIRVGSVDTDPRGTWALGRVGPSLVAGCDNLGDCYGINTKGSNGDDVADCTDSAATGNGCWGSGDGQMPRLPARPQGVHSLDYPYQGSRAPTWASHIIMSDEGADFLRIPAPGTHAAPAFVSPNIFCCALSRFGHNMVAFAQQEGQVKAMRLLSWESFRSIRLSGL